MAACNSHKINQLKWLEGKWRHLELPVEAYEEWNVLADGSMRGVGYQIENQGDTLVVERFALAQIGDNLQYSIEVVVDGNVQKSTFTATEMQDNIAVFESARSQFPRKVIFEKVSPDERKLTFFGLIEGEEMEFIFISKREKNVSNS